MAADAVFEPTSGAWVARPTDANDTFVAQLMGDEARVGLFGIPFDGAVLGRRGGRGGPDAVRQQLAKLKPWTLAQGEYASPLRDWGNVRLASPDDVAAAHPATERAARVVIAAGAFPVALGGDHSLTCPLVKAHGGKVGVINLDAHLDVRDYKDVPNSGTSFGRLLADGITPGRNLVEVGLRDFANSDKHATKAKAAGATLFLAEEWRAEPNVVIDHAIEVASQGVDAVYLSVDMDVLDQAHAPGVSAPTPGGIDTALLYAAIRRIAEHAPLVGADFMEVAPNLDRDDMTARAAAYAVMHLLAGLPKT